MRLDLKVGLSVILTEAERLFLTKDELADLTDCKRKSDQIRWLKARRYPFEVGDKGNPKVLRSVVFDRMQAKSAQPQIRLREQAA